jgi:hypothetical protein
LSIVLKVSLNLPLYINPIVIHCSSQFRFRHQRRCELGLRVIWYPDSYLGIPICLHVTVTPPGLGVGLVVSRRPSCRPPSPAPFIKLPYHHHSFHPRRRYKCFRHHTIKRRLGVDGLGHPPTAASTIPIWPLTGPAKVSGARNPRPWICSHHVTAPPPASTSKPGLVDTGLVKAALGEKERKPLTIKVRKPAPKPSIPGNWKESDAISTLYPVHVSKSRVQA